MAVSRRKLLRNSVIGAAAACTSPDLLARVSKAPLPNPVDYYQRLGVTPFINAAGTYTVLSASTMPPEVQAAISLASQQPVHLNELLVASANTWQKDFAARPPWSPPVRLRRSP